MDLKDQGFRFVKREEFFAWVHPTEVLPDDVDCSDMSDAEFELFVLENESR